MMIGLTHRRNNISQKAIWRGVSWQCGAIGVLYFKLIFRIQLGPEWGATCDIGIDIITSTKLISGIFNMQNHEPDRLEW